MHATNFIQVNVITKNSKKIINGMDTVLAALFAFYFYKYNFMSLF